MKLFIKNFFKYLTIMVIYFVSSIYLNSMGAIYFRNWERYIIYSKQINMANKFYSNITSYMDESGDLGFDTKYSVNKDI